MDLVNFNAPTILKLVMTVKGEVVKLRRCIVGNQRCVHMIVRGFRYILILVNGEDNLSKKTKSCTNVIFIAR